MDFIANSKARGALGTPLTPVALEPIIRVTAFIKIKRENH